MDLTGIKGAVQTINSETLPEAAALANQIVANAAALIGSTLEGIEAWANSAIERSEKAGERLMNRGAGLLHEAIDRLNGATVTLSIPARIQQEVQPVITRHDSIEVVERISG